ncbi:hypothetical protein GQ42DRAFT_72145 [Ramicandelaber brevisporus]|nr:hypothetical protein GQ42DRAFT_72145 [Ramicandelaber brevisporus]
MSERVSRLEADNALAVSRAEEAASDAKHTLAQLNESEAASAAEKAALDARISSLERQRDDAQRQLVESDSVVSSLRGEIKRVTKDLDDAQERYESELVRHSDTITALSTLRRQLSQPTAVIATSTVSSTESCGAVNAEERQALVDQISLLRESNAMLRSELALVNSIPIPTSLKSPS